MAVAHEAYARSHAGVGSSASESSFAFDLAATNAAGVLVFVLSFGNTSNLVSAVDVEGVAASLVSGGRAVDTAGETGDCQAWFVGSGLPAGTLTITVTRTNNSVTMMAYAVSFTASANTEAYAAGLVLDQEDGTLAERSVDDGSPGTDSLRYAALNTGLGAPPSVGGNTTSLAADDYGARCSAMARETTAGQGSRSIGWSSASSDDRAAVYIAVYESSSGGAVDLVIQDASHAHAADNLALTQQHELAVDDATHAHAADNLTLSTEIELSIADALHGHSVDNITLVQQHVLVVDDATHGHSADNVVLATGTNLAIADALHAHTVDNLALTQQHVLVVADAFHQHSADNVVLGGLPVAQAEEGGGGPDREESEQPAERFTDDASGWRKPKWVREREQLAAAARISTEEQQDAEPRRASPVAESLAPAVSDSGDAGVAPGLERASPQSVLEVTAPAQQTAAVDLERARIAAKVRQQREIEEIMTVLMMAA